ncbi:antitoxin [Ruania alkalisoli]|uniref:Antitoxin n=1 Tax=Ruania alkalisoli TaxID=2779775 RepID=A0A7M1STU0_9MICO|nr:antitoxin [Ruania alkalisoli]QOR70998.1 antitoxin [Ruania alkalisoli]
MSVMERRLQLLLDRARYERVAAEAARSHRSVAAVIREAIDLQFPDDRADVRARAAQSFLALQPDGVPGECAADLKRQYAEESAVRIDSL